MKRIILLVSLGLFLAGIAVPVLVYYNRPPVLVVTNVSFVALYGAERARRQQVSASLALFRPVKPVVVDDAADSDVLAIAVSAAAEKPFCVLFSYIHADAAKRYHEEFQEIPVVVFGGRANTAGLPAADGVLCIYGTDRGTDMYRAGLMAGIINVATRNTAQKEAAEAAKAAEVAKEAEETAEGTETTEPEIIQMDVMMLQDRSVTEADRGRFSGGVEEEDTEAKVRFVRTVAEIPDSGGISCVVISAGGSDYLEKNPQLPIILFTWVDPAYLSKEVTVIFDDSPWALAVPAVRMAAGNPAGGLAEGKIPSKPLILSEGGVEKSVFKRLKISAKKNTE
jgi:hypothetical protein